MLTNEMLELQKDLEAQSLQVGHDKYLADQEYKEEREGFERRDDARRVLQGCLPQVAAEIASWIAKASATAGRATAGLAPLKMMDPDLLALAGLQAAFHSIPKGDTVTTVMTNVGHVVQTELEAMALANTDKKAAKAFEKLASKETSSTRNQKRHEKAVRKTDKASGEVLYDVGLGWDGEQRLRVGAPVLNAVLKGAREVFRTRKGGSDGRQKVVGLTREAEVYMACLADDIAWLRPRYVPMVVEPRPWTAMNTGAYMDEKLAKTVPLIRGAKGEQRRLTREAIADGSMQRDLDALNAIQATGYRIDARTLPWIKWARAQSLKPSKGFPLGKLPELPKHLTKDEWAATAPEVREALSRNRKKVRDIRSAAAIDAGTFQSDIETAEFLLEEADRFWLPASMDFRGRVYAVPHFNFQRTEYIKAMFLLADGDPMGPEGGDWLMIHVANTGDFKNAEGTKKMSKCSFDDRIAWVRENEQQIILVALDPEGTYDFWSQADKPFLFLQACMEYKDWWMSGNSEDFVSHLAIGQDGSCSGLQHYSAMTRSAEEGALVNLMPNDAPADIYNATADKARPTLELAAKGGCKFAQRVLEVGFGRSTVKRNVMTYFYGSGKFGMRDQHMQDTMRPLADKVALEGGEHPYAFMVEREIKDPKTKKVTGTKMELDGGFNCALTLASHVYKAVTDVAPMADAAANWFQAVASILAHESHPVIWRTPLGMPVVHRYAEWETKQVHLWLYDRDVPVLEAAKTDKVDEDGDVLAYTRLIMQTNPTKRIDKAKARSAISPNVVHSLDGSHLKDTVNMGYEQGIRAFMLTHDEFATTAGKSALFAAIIRRSFVEMYQAYSPFEAIEEYARSVLSPEGLAKLDEANRKRPPLGTLDLEDVKHALYAFA